MSDSKKYYYLKLKDNFYDRPEIKMIEGMQNGYEYICVMQKMYLRSLCRDGKLLLTDTVPYDIHMLSSVLGHDEAVIKAATEIFSKLGLCTMLEDHTIYMTEIQNFIGESTTEADRIRDYRLRIKGHGVQLPYKCTPEIETELKIELKTEKKKAKKNTSLSEILDTITNDDLRTALTNWIESRKEGKSPVTKTALILGVNKLDRLFPGDINGQIDCVNETIINGWKGFWKKDNNRFKKKGYDPTDQQQKDALKRILEA
jgi:predicted phage replisome organizer